MGVGVGDLDVFGGDSWSLGGYSSPFAGEFTSPIGSDDPRNGSAGFNPMPSRQLTFGKAGYLHYNRTKILSTSKNATDMISYMENNLPSQVAKLVTPMIRQQIPKLESLVKSYFK